MYFPCSKNLFFLFLIFHSDERHRPDTSDTIRGSRPGTSTSKNSSRPSTRATVDYGFYQTIDDDTMNVPYDGEHQQHQQDEEEPPTPRLRGNNRNNENNGRNEEQRINTEIENPEEEEYQRMNEYQEQQNRGGRSPNQNHAQVGFQQDQQPHHQQQHQQHQQQHQPHEMERMSRPDTASELRRRLTAPMVVNDIDEPIENLVVGAAMQTYIHEKDTGVTTENAFDTFIERLLEFPKGPAGERDRRNLVRERTRGMLRWVKPYLVTLRKQNLLTIRSIVDLGRPIEALALPIPIQEKLREVIGNMLPHSTASIGFDKRFQRSKLDSIGRPPPPADILDFETGVTPADQFYASHTIHVDYASEFKDRPTRKRWPGSKIQVYPIAAMESDYGK